MTLNPFFLNGSKTEQSLVQDLINEQLRMYGIEVYYVPRSYITTNTVIREYVNTQLNNAYPIEAYVSTYDGYGGQGTLLSKFGIQDVDDLTLVISKERFETYITPLSEGLPDIKLNTRPKEGDIIYFPLGDRIFEIKYVEHESPFYQLQKNYVYELKCELFRYGSELMNTGVNEIDDNSIDEGSLKSFTVVGVGSTAIAVTTIRNGAVNAITLTNRGHGYTTAPRVGISSSPESSGTAVGIATLITGIVDECDPLGTGYRVQGVEITNPGFGYTLAPSVQFYGGGGVGAEATASIGDGSIGIVTITSGGSGYTTSPTVTFVGIASTSASAYASISSAGIVTAIFIRNAGVGYTEVPTITFSSPAVGLGGTFTVNEVVVGSISSTTARVNSWNAVTNELILKNLDGDFVNGERVVGQGSSAVYEIRTQEEFNTKDTFASNDDIETGADSILDFTQTNPFGTP